MEWKFDWLLKAKHSKHVPVCVCACVQRPRRVREGRVALDGRRAFVRLGAAHWPQAVHAVRGVRGDADDEQRGPHVHESDLVLHDEPDAAARAAHCGRPGRYALRSHHPVRYSSLRCSALLCTRPNPSLPSSLRPVPIPICPLLISGISEPLYIFDLSSSRRQYQQMV